MFWSLSLLILRCACCGSGVFYCHCSLWLLSLPKNMVVKLLLKFVFFFHAQSLCNVWVSCNFPAKRHAYGGEGANVKHTRERRTRIGVEEGSGVEREWCGRNGFFSSFSCKFRREFDLSPNSWMENKRSWIQILYALCLCSDVPLWWKYMNSFF